VAGIRPNGEDDALSFGEIVDIEHCRNDIFTELHSAAGGFRLIFSYYGTILPKVFMTGSFWGNYFVYIAIRSLYLLKYRLPTFPVTVVTVIGSFLSFFLVFFASQSYSRFSVQYANSNAIMGHIVNICLLAQASLPAAHRLRIWRLLNASHLAAYSGLGNTYNEENFFDPINHAFHLLTPQETSRAKLQKFKGGAVYRELLANASSVIFSFKSSKKFSDDKCGDHMWKELTLLRGFLSKMFEYSNQPIPFVYIHLIVLTSAVYLPLFSYSLATNPEVTKYNWWIEAMMFFIIGVTNLFVLGLRSLGVILADPYGVDIQDFSVLNFVMSTIQCTRRLCTDVQLETFDENLEVTLENKRPPLSLILTKDVYNY
jgi:hypothetical protein